MNFNGLDQVDWAHISHSHGTAEQFPEWLNDLASGDDTAWLNDENYNGALSNLWRHSIHQGSVYEVTPYVIPFINQLLNIASREHQGILLVMLTSFAYGHQVARENDSWLREVYKKGGLDFDVLLRQSKQVYDDTQARLRESLSLYISFLEDVLPKKRLAAAELVGAIARQSSEARQALLTHLEHETDAKVRAEIENILNLKHDRPEDNKVS